MISWFAEWLQLVVVVILAYLIVHFLTKKIDWKKHFGWMTIKTDEIDYPD